MALHNLDRALERGGKIEDLVESTDRLQEQGNIFQRVAAKQKCMERRRNLFWTIVLTICCLVPLSAPPSLYGFGSLSPPSQILLALIVGVILLIVYT